jgi:hypothetical protein
VHLNRVVYAGFDYDNQPENCGPRELANFLFDAFNEFPGQNVALACSQDSFRKLTEIAFSCSLLAEEGRYPRFRIIIERAEAAGLPFPVLAALTTPRPINSPDDLRKLAPAVYDPDSALWITEVLDGETKRLECRGILDATHYARTLIIGRPDNTSGRTASGEVYWAALAVESPGQLRAGCFSLPGDFLLRGGKIRLTVGFSTVLARALKGVPELLETRIRSAAGEELAKYISFSTPQMHLHDVWSDILSDIEERRHGGAVIVVPRIDSSPEELRAVYGFADGFDVSLDLGAAFVDFHVECAKIRQWHVGSVPNQIGADNPYAGLLNSGNQWFSARRRLARVIHAIAMLTAVDGCVVMDRSLKAHLFGAKIREPIGEMKEREEKLKLRRAQSRDEIPADAMRQFGTRTNSACGFCQCFSNSAAFVVSQDTDLRVFQSDSEGCYRFEWLESKNRGGLVE